MYRHHRHKLFKHLKGQGYQFEKEAHEARRGAGFLNPKEVYGLASLRILRRKRKYGY